MFYKLKRYFAISTLLFLIVSITTLFSLINIYSVGNFQIVLFIILFFGCFITGIGVGLLIFDYLNKKELEQ